LISLVPWLNSQPNLFGYSTKSRGGLSSPRLNGLESGLIREHNGVAVALAVTVVGLVPWVLATTVGAALIVTGRPLPLAIRSGVREGWRIRLAGLVYCVIGLGYFYLVLRSGGMYFDAVVGGYLALAAGIWYAARQARTTAT
jgi:hypothetical protein